MTESDLDPQTRFTQLVQRALEIRESGGEADLEALCADTPQILSELRQTLRLASALPSLARMTDHHDPWVGETIHERYRLERQLGSGAMGVVYQAMDTRLQRAVAIKLLHRALQGNDEVRARFQREALALAALADPHVVGIHDAGVTAQGQPFLVMELLTGRSLAAYLSEASDGLEPDQVARWGLEIARGLAAAHHAGLLHRDVKPSNVFIRQDGHAVLVDFGIVRRTDDAELTATNATLGTPWYMAPELTSPGAESSQHADVYGLGATLYHMLALQPPYVGSGAAVLAQVANEDPPTLAHRALPADLRAIVERAMEREPRHRYPSAAAMARDLEAFLERAPVQARPLGASARLWRRVRRRPARALAITGLVAAAGVSAWFVPPYVAAQRAQSDREREARISSAISQLMLEPPMGRPTALNRPAVQSVMADLQRAVELTPRGQALVLLQAAVAREYGVGGTDRNTLATEAAGGSEFCSSLAQRIRECDPGAAIPLDDLPAPVTHDERLLLAHLVVRQRLRSQYAQTLTMCQSAMAAAGVRELRCGLLLDLGEFDQAHEAAQRIEGQLGQTTAFTRYVIGTALLGRKQIAAAEPPLLEALALRRCQPVLQNLAVVLRRQGRHAEVPPLLREAIALRPDLSLGHVTLIQSLTDQGRFEAALTALSQCEPCAREPGLMDTLAGRIELNTALHAAVAGNQELVKSHAGKSCLRFQEAVRTGAHRQSLRLDIALAVALRDGDINAALAAVLSALQSDPTNPAHIRNAAALLDSNLDVHALTALRDYLIALSEHLAPTNAPLRDNATVSPPRGR